MAYSHTVPLYRLSEARCCSHRGSAACHGALRAEGIMQTSVQEEDLPPCYVRVYVRGSNGEQGEGMLSAQGVTHLAYAPNYYLPGPPFAFDSLFVSYDGPLSLRDEGLGAQFRGHQYVVYGAGIPAFLEAVGQYAPSCDCAQARAELRRKQAWYVAGSAPSYEGFGLLRRASEDCEGVMGEQ